MPERSKPAAWAALLTVSVSSLTRFMAWDGGFVGVQLQAIHAAKTEGQFQIGNGIQFLLTIRLLSFSQGISFFLQSHALPMRVLRILVAKEKQIWRKFQKHN